MAIVFSFLALPFPNHKLSFPSTLCYRCPVSTHPLVAVELEENVETAAQVRAIAAAKVSKGVAAREAERRTRKAKRAGGRVDAAVQHIISPDSVEGMFQAMAFLRKQVRLMVAGVRYIMFGVCVCSFITRQCMQLLRCVRLPFFLLCEVF